MFIGNSAAASRSVRPSLFVNLDGLHRADPRQQYDGILLRAGTIAIPVDGICDICGEGAGMEGEGELFVVGIAGADPPSARDDIDPAGLVMEVGV